MAGKRVLSIGQCGPDHYSISWTLRAHFAAEVVPARDGAEALEQLKKGSFDLVLVNRILDADHASGLQLLRQIKATPGQEQTPIMLVSNLPDAQQQATSLGALPGFGKDLLADDSLIDLLRPQLG
ncbi:MAG TPA: response regulator [Gemmataceae bacterium]|jgi:two-component system chemotaxis response regulator CheY|nr:response regulator [Gemmataceae bacterium]